MEKGKEEEEEEEKKKSIPDMQEYPVLFCFTLKFTFHF